MIRAIFGAAALVGLGACATMPVSSPVRVSTIVAEIEGSGDVSVGPDGSVYLADFGVTLRQAGGQNIYRIAPDGSSVEVVNAEFGGASGNEFDMQGGLLQSDVARGEAWRVEPDGSRTMLADGLASPVGITDLPDAGVFVAECTANAIAYLAPDGSARRIAEGAPLACPNGLTHASDDNLYAVNFRDGALVRIDPASGATETLVTLPDAGLGHLAWANDRFYVASFRGGKIYSVTMSGEVCWIAGSGARSNSDGDALAASFFRPNGMAITEDGDTLFTNVTTSIVEPESLQLHSNAVRRVDGLLSLLDCPDDRRISR